MARSSQFAVVLVAAFAGCNLTEVSETFYPDMAAVVAGGGISGGWIPKWLPASSTDLREIHNIDTNESALTFSISSNTSWYPPGQCQAVPASAVVPSRYHPSRWPTPSELDSSYTFFRCPSDVSPTSMFVGVHKSGGQGLHWRVSAR